LFCYFFCHCSRAATRLFQVQIEKNKWLKSLKVLSLAIISLLSDSSEMLFFFLKLYNSMSIMFPFSYSVMLVALFYIWWWIYWSVEWRINRLYYDFPHNKISNKVSVQMYKRKFLLHFFLLTMSFVESEIWAMQKSEIFHNLCDQNKKKNLK
jgi:hypothetical protein